MNDELFRVLPEYPRTKHLFTKPKGSDDEVAVSYEAKIVHQLPVQITEKIDGSNCGMSLYDGQPVIRNRNHILTKGYNKRTPAKMQFSSIWNWWYKNKAKFEKLNKISPSLSVYGEWMFAQHGMEYDELPDLFIAYDIYDYDVKKFIGPARAKTWLYLAGFAQVPQLFYGRLPNDYGDIPNMKFINSFQGRSAFTSKGKREGLYLKVTDGDGQYVIDRFKVVRDDFVQGALWDDTKLKKNKVIKASPIFKIW